MLEKIHIIVTLLAALAVTILSLFQDITFFELSERLLVIIPVFFVIGLFFRFYLKKLLIPVEEEITDDENDDAEQDSEDAEITESSDEDAPNPYDIDDFDL